MSSRWARAALSHRICTGISDRALGKLVEELAPPWLAQQESRLRTLADVFAYAAASGVTLRVDGTEVQVRRLKAGRPGRRAFVSGKKRQNTGKATAVSDGDGRLLWLGAFRPGRMHDATALRTEGIEDLLRRHPDVRAEVDTGYQGLARDFPGQVSAPPKKPGKDATAAEAADLRAGPPHRSQYALALPLGCVGLARRFWAGRYWQPRPAAGTGP